MDLNTNSDLFPEGTYRFVVADVPEQGETKTGHLYFQFVFSVEFDGEQQTYRERFMRWMMAPLCRALGFEEYKPGKFHFEPTSCVGREIEASIQHEVIKEGPSAGKVVARMKDIKPVGAMAPAKRAAMVAQAPADSDIPF